MQRKLSVLLLLLLPLMGCAASELGDEEDDTSVVPETPNEPDEEVPQADAEECEVQKDPPLMVMSYNVKRGLLSGNHPIAAALSTHSPGLVGVQEIANGTSANGGGNQLYNLAQYTGLGPALRNAKAVDGGYQANGLLSGYPILDNERFDLSATDESRIMVVLTVAIAPDFIATVGVTHFSTREADRVLEAQEVVDILGARPNPMLIGDLNARPDEESISILKTAFRDTWDIVGEDEGFTFPAQSPDRRIDYVFVGPGWPDPIGAYVAEDQASDHLALAVYFPRP